MKDHKLDNVQFFQTPNMGGMIVPKVVVLHYSSGRNIMSSVRWFSSEKSRASSHVLIGRDGKVIQMVPFNMKAWHCGRSMLGGQKNVNDFSIGIELCNWGVLQFKNSIYTSCAGVTVYDESVIAAAHRFNKERSCYWEKYTEDQILACIDVCAKIKAFYGIDVVVGHDEIAVPRGRVLDPGPAFPTKRLLDSIAAKEIDNSHTCIDPEYEELMQIKNEVENIARRVDRFLNRRDD